MSRKTEYVHNPCFLSANILKILGVFAENQNSFPAVFLKKVANFNDEIYLKDIAETHRKIWNYKKVLFLYVYSETEIRIYNCSETKNGINSLLIKDKRNSEVLNLESHNLINSYYESNHTKIGILKHLIFDFTNNLK